MKTKLCHCKQEAWDALLVVSYINELTDCVWLFTSLGKWALVVWYLQTVPVFLWQTERLQLSTYRIHCHRLRCSLKYYVVQQIATEFSVSAVNLFELSIWRFVLLSSSLSASGRTLLRIKFRANKMRWSTIPCISEVWSYVYLGVSYVALTSPLWREFEVEQCAGQLFALLIRYRGM